VHAQEASASDVYREVPRRRRSIADEAVSGEVARQAAHVVAVEDARARRLSRGDGELLSAPQPHRRVEIAALEGMVGDRQLPALGGMGLDRDGPVVAADDVVVDMGSEPGEKARDAEAHLPGRWLGARAGSEQPGDHQCGARRQGQTTLTPPYRLAFRGHGWRRRRSGRGATPITRV